MMTEEELKDGVIYSAIWSRSDDMIELDISEESYTEFMSTLFKDEGEEV